LDGLDGFGQPPTSFESDAITPTHENPHIEAVMKNATRPATPPISQGP
jgi:hypothetical protein